MPAQVTAILEATKALWKLFTPGQTRQILSSPILSITNTFSLNDLPVPFLMLSFGHAIDTGDRARAEGILTTLSNRPSSQAELAAMVAGDVMRLTDEEAVYTRGRIALPEFTTMQPARTIWRYNRYAAVMGGLGYDIIQPAADYSFSAPPPEWTMPDTVWLKAFRNAIVEERAAESLLASIMLLSQAPLPYISDLILEETLELWRRYGLEDLARSLAVEALLAVPFPPLDTTDTP
jgi:hypothetical protein